ncbi:oligosaccharide flippase family protein [Nocardioides sp.]|uniref:lipopolysaccharide biosynthesis protein n=1 Tax=Nocardioides sp. TaxID=35761 RepID=UPI002612A0BF|nr:oligosaccharide flippase family protein [Nocardioides sp.]
MASAVVGAATTPVLAWTATAEDVGRFNLLMVYVGLGVVVSCLGLDQAYIRFHHDARRRGRLLTAAMLLPVTVSGIFAGAILVAPSWFAEQAFDLRAASVGVGLAAAIVLNVIYRFAAVEIRMAESPGALLVNQVVPKVILICAVLLASVLGAGVHFEIIVWVYAAGLAAALAVWSSRLFSRAVLHAERTGEADTRQMLRYGVPLTASALAFWVAASTGAVGLRALASIQEVALYALALSFALPASLLQVVLASVWTPIVFRWNDIEAREQLPKVQRMVSAGAVWLFLVLGSGSWAVHWLLPSQYASVEYMIPAAMAPALWYAVSEVTAVGIQIRKRTSLLALASSAAAAVGVITVVPLAAALGARGALLSMMAAYGTLFVVRTELSARVWMSVPRRRLYLQAALVGVLASSVLLGGPFLGVRVYLVWVAAVVILAVIDLFETSRRSRRVRVP